MTLDSGLLLATLYIRHIKQKRSLNYLLHAHSGRTIQTKLK